MLGISIRILWHSWGLADNTVFQFGHKSNPAATVLVFFCVYLSVYWWTLSPRYCSPLSPPLLGIFCSCPPLLQSLSCESDCLLSYLISAETYNWSVTDQSIEPSFLQSMYWYQIFFQFMEKNFYSETCVLPSGAPQVGGFFELHLSEPLLFYHQSGDSIVSPCLQDITPSRMRRSGKVLKWM